MKHSMRITLFLIAIFFSAQIVGLWITDSYVDHATGVYKPLPFSIERPQVEQNMSFIYIFIAIIFGTMLLLFLIKLKGVMLWKFWFFISVIVTLTFSFGAFMSDAFAALLAVILAIWKIFKPNVYIHNLTEIFIYGGLAAIFAPILNVFSAAMLLILISVYDAYAVWKSKHMIKLAKSQAEAKIFAGVFIPYTQSSKKARRVLKQGRTKTLRLAKGIKSAVLGGGDIGFPLIFTAVVMKNLTITHSPSISFLLASIIVLTATASLTLLLLKSKKDKFYPAMPFITAGCFIGYAAVWIITQVI